LREELTEETQVLTNFRIHDSPLRP
jgi:hypothetical protein